LRKIIKEIKYILTDLENQKTTEEFEYILLCHDDHRSVTCNNKQYSPLTDSILERLKQSGFTLGSFSIPYSALKSDKAYGNPRSLNGAYSRARTLQKIYQYTIGIFTKERLDRKFIVRFWIYFLKKYNPIEVICIQPSEELCSAGKICRVQISDIQHGVMDETRYYCSREGWQFGKEGVPDKVYCWDEHSARIIKKKWPEVNALVFGNPFIQRLKISYKEFLTTNSELTLNKLLGRRVVLITLQYDEKSLSLIKIPRNIIESIKLCQASDTIFCIKFHPVQLRSIGHKELIKIFKEEYGGDLWSSIIDVSDIPLAIVLNFINYQISESSASAIDAAYFNIKSGFWDQSEKVKNWFQSYIDSGCIEFLPQNHLEISMKILQEVSRSKHSG
jgi:hypothetical protein